MNSNSIVLITGVTGLIGREIAKNLASTGCTIVLVARDDQRLESLADALRSEHPDAKPVCCPLDLVDPEAADWLMRFLNERNLQPDVFVHCARGLEWLNQGAGGAISRGNWAGEFHLAVVAPYELTWQIAADPGARLRSVVLVSSMYGVTAPNLALYETPSGAPPVHYGVCKAAQIHLMRELAVRLAAKNIRVNAVSYGGLVGRTDASFQARYSLLCPAGRMLTATEIAGPVRFLVSDEASATTGHNLLADGGWTIW
jgi:NAD(P)-dependent dehydrogenase (short-subunit alcohol dehydrogenase family)